MRPSPVQFQQLLGAKERNLSRHGRRGEEIKFVDVNRSDNVYALGPHTQPALHYPPRLISASPFQHLHPLVYYL